MRIALVCDYSGCLSWAKRLHDEGHDVLLYIGGPKKGASGRETSLKKVGTGIVPRTESYTYLISWIKDGHTKGEPAMILFALSGQGERADDARKMGLYVVGGGSICDKMEFDRTFGRQLAEEAGILIPPYTSFPTLSATIKHAEEQGKNMPEVYFKTDSFISSDCTKKCKDSKSLISYVKSLRDQDVKDATKNDLEECVDGVAVSTERWWNGRAWVGPFFGLIERKKFMTDEVGPSTGCSMNAVWAYKDTPMTAEALHWEELGAVFTKHKVPAGLYDINAILKDGEAYFLEFCARLGYDSEPTGQMLYNELGRWLWFVATGQGDGGGFRDGIAVSLHLSVPPYPIFDAFDENHKKSPMGAHINGKNLGDLHSGPFIGYEVMAEDGQLMVGGPDGDVGLAACVGESLADCAEQNYEFAKDGIECAGLQFRSDAGKAILEDAEKALEQGFSDLPEELYN
jgi:phosphoribosylamine-glycine ligase